MKYKNLKLQLKIERINQKYSNQVNKFQFNLKNSQMFFGTLNISLDYQIYILKEKQVRMQASKRKSTF
ncbi:hypothetical protein TTHERM_00530410 (macronuclear) [Tetrahymena thermophila SB210]|uniref:Uncharacterized protein n=1 Tax=Tetrahymena thermophila (strain SB210) TaxID=312017 RepID=I7LTE2_TETTS|nr:hypothetical protein TTHERM_00530410 [Tetrahymena thermophila SB210]EAR85083.2 hypothetical protein TTHERM_00530410 [Tetrahymena thermophila SB210]|eukprot:XP_001032746.2 hypothetical protein TTHERM_00530410 [Tetrahymena thermophila SB210]